MAGRPSNHQAAAQAKEQAGVAQRLELTDAPLHRAGAGGETAHIAPPAREPVHSDFLGGAQMDGLGTDLGIAVNDQLADLAHGECLLLPGGVRDRQGFSRLADSRPMCRDVDGLAFPVLGKQPNRLPVIVFCQTFFLG